MKRVGIGLALALGLASSSAHAAVDDALPPAPEPRPLGKQEVGVRVGAQLGLGEVSPGGVRLGGVFLYRLADAWWFDGDAAVAFGRDQRECGPAGATDPTLECDHGVLDGFSLRLAVGARYVLDARPSGFVPYLRGGVYGGAASFGEDDVGGPTFGLTAAGGLRIRVADPVALVGEAQLDAGWAFYGGDIGTRGTLALTVLFGVDFALE